MIIQIRAEHIILIIILVICLCIVLVVLRTIFRIIKWIFRSIISLFTGKKYYSDPLQSDDWLVRAQAKQEIRFQNSLPPLLPKAKPKRKNRKRENEDRKSYPTGWHLDEETGQWAAPDKIKKEANKKWKWSEEKQTWVNRGK